ncbi:ABC transporter permease [Brevirhabdus sp.]|uniref:ABC transporter permease n=1 Tax=Brevirhabdus sp. TaxID=2004514 RepID=UPI0040589B60
MRLPVSLRIARRELRAGMGAFRILLICLALGVGAIASVGTVRDSIRAGLAVEGAALLGGDAEMEFTYRFASEAEKAWMADVATRVSEVVDFRSMAVVDRNGQQDRALTQIKGVDDAYPLVGSVGLSPAMPLERALSGDGTRPGAVMDRVLADRLGLKTGDGFRLGERDFVLSALLTREPDNATGGFSLGPRTLVRTADLRGSGLLEPGSLFDSAYRLALPPGTDLEAVKTRAEARFSDSGLRWHDARNGAPGIKRFVDRIGAFLVLIGLAGLAVGGIGVSAAVRAYLGGKITTIATLRSLGAGSGTIWRVYLAQISAVSALGILAGLVLGALLPVLAGPLIEARLPIPADITWRWSALGEAALYGVLAAMLFTLWPLARTEDVQAAALFRDGSTGGRRLPRMRFVLATGVLLAALVGAAAVLSGLPRLALYTAGGILVALAVLALVALGLRLLARRLARSRMLRGRPSLRMAMGAIGGPREQAASVILSLGLGLAVLATVGQIDANLRNAIDRELPKIAPSYFFVDIGDDQLPGFMARLQGDPGVSRIQTAPMLRGVIARINGVDAQKVAGNHWVVRGDRGLTFSARPPENTTITAGKWWPEGYDGPPQVSFAQDEAREIGLKLGDMLTLNVLGRDIEAEVTSFRSVDFSTAGIGFVMVLNPGALAGAPYTSIATVYASPQSEVAILRDLARQFPNITAIRVADAIEKVAQMLRGLAAAISIGAGVTLLTGFVVLIGAAAAGEQARIYEAAVLKTLGAGRALVLGSFALRSALLGAAAGAVALLAGTLAAWGVMRFVMNASFQIAWGPALLIVTLGVLATLLAGAAFAWRPLSRRPAAVLRSRE